MARILHTPRNIVYRAEEKITTGEEMGYQETLQ